MKNKLTLILPPLIFLLILLGIWQLIIGWVKPPAWLLPSISDVAAAFYDSKELLWQHTLTTLGETWLGFILAVGCGILAACVMSFFPWVKRTLYPFIIVSQTIPLISVAPLFILWFGYGLLPKILIIALVCFFPITISLYHGLEQQDKDLTRLMQSMNSSRRQIFRYVSVPQALPSLFSGLKIAATYSVMGAIIGEWLGAGSGLGVYLTRSSHSFLTNRVFAGIIVITILSLGFYALIALLGRWADPRGTILKRRKNHEKTLC